jgi:DNA-binding NarL/FixJ family response regulator
VTATSQPRVLIIDDHIVLGEVIASSLREHGFDVALATARTSDDLVSECRDLDPDVTVLDLGLWAEVGDGLDLIGPLRETGTKVIVLTGAADRLLHARSIECGADGVVEKSRPFEDILTAINAGLVGLPVNPLWEIEALRAELREAVSAQRERLAPFEQLTPREAVVLAGLMRGENASDLAKAQFVSLATVRTHIRSILTKLNVHSQLAAVAKAREVGWEFDDEMLAS